MFSRKEFRLLNRLKRPLTTAPCATSAADPVSKGAERGSESPSQTDRFCVLQTGAGANAPLVFGAATFRSAALPW